jgi:hypothetical protein
MDDGQKTPCGHPDFHSYMKIQRVFIFQTSFWLTLFYSTLLALTHRQKNRRRLKYTCCAWAGGTFFSSCAVFCVSFWFWREIGFDLHTHVLRVPYSCGVVLVFWLRQEIVFGVMYILSVQ